MRLYESFWPSTMCKKPYLPLLVWSALSFLPNASEARLRASYDPICDSMTANPPSFADLMAMGKSYFDEPIPRTLVLVNLCGRKTAWRESWRRYAAVSNYNVIEAYTPHLDDDQLTIASDLLLQIQNVYAQGDCLTAEKMLRWAILATHGGIAVDLRVQAPLANKSIAAFESLLKLHGLVVLTADKPQNTRQLQSGITASDSIIASSKNHPILKALVATLPANIASVERHYPAAGPEYRAGSILLTRMLNGPISILPRNFVVLMPEDGEAYDEL